MKRHYTIVSCNCDSLPGKVDIMVRRGWQPVGGLAATPDGRLHQALYSARGAEAQDRPAEEKLPTKSRWWPFS